LQLISIGVLGAYLGRVFTEASTARSTWSPNAWGSARTKRADERGGPLVTVGIPSFRSERFIAEAIASVLSQDVASLEVVVADDASDDRTVEIARGFDDPRVRVLTSETNLGAGRNWNRVLDEARGRYVKVMGHDDVLVPGSLAAQVAVLEAIPTS